MTIIDTLIWQMQGDSSKLKDDLDKARKGIKGVEKDTIQADAAIKQMSDSLLKMGSTVLLAFVGGAAKQALEDQLDLGTKINETAERVGNSASAVNRFAHSLNAAGEDVSAGLDMLEQFNQRVSQNEQAMNDAGIATRKHSGELRDSLSIYQSVIDRSKTMQAAQRAQLFKRLGINEGMAVDVGGRGLVSAEFLQQAAQRKQILDNISKIQGEIRTKFGSMFGGALLAWDKLRLKLSEKIKHRFPEIAGAVAALTAALLTARGAALGLSLAMLAIKNPITAATIATVAALGTVLGDAWGNMTPDERDTWLADMEKALPNVAALIKTLIKYWNDLLSAAGATSVFELMAIGVGKLLGFVDDVLYGLRKVGSFLGLNSPPPERNASSSPATKPADNASPSALPVVPEVAAVHNQQMTTTSVAFAPIQASKPNVTITDNRKIDVRPVFNVNGNMDEKMSEKMTGKIQDVVRKELERESRNLATQAATGQLR